MRRFLINVNGNSYNVEVEELGAAAPTATPAAPVQQAAPAIAPTPAAAPQQAKPAAAPAPAPAAAPADGVSISAPMPGTILDINVTVEMCIRDSLKAFE